jgi:hypothetical protein
MKVAGLPKQAASDRSTQHRCLKEVLSPAGAIVSPRVMVPSLSIRRFTMLNKVQLIGFLGADPDVRFTQ